MSESEAWQAGKGLPAQSTVPQACAIVTGGQGHGLPGHPEASTASTVQKTLEPRSTDRPLCSCGRPPAPAPPDPGC